ncbi:TonB-dependent receptor [Foetidibacter luteolus]|uniref:TonB-dependent receptor n=1 Tax=Foetidibacter luteolus TaxID=2608880 RepID=UPI00129B8A7E|nr:TonB-dependent receptor [Foetidibacter luteolus]
MKKLLLLLGIIISYVQLQAQFPGGGGAAANIGHIYGKVVDSAGKPVAEASVILLQNKLDTATKKKKDVLLKGLTTKSNGEFSLEELPMFGPLKLKISAVGFKDVEQTISFMPAGGPKPGGTGGGMPSFDKDLGNIKLSADANVLQGVTVTASQPLMKMDIDKKVFNVEKNITSAGGTALDVMRNVPSLQVDIDGNVKLRNAAPQLYIDGRPTTLSLDQIPADAIESVEVITNPSAKYDASGGNAGILNIVLKKNKKSGYNGNIMAGVDRRGGINGGGNFNLRQDKFNFSAAFMTNQMRNRTTGTTDRLNFGDVNTQVFQQNTNKTNGGFMFGRLGLDYFLTNRTTLSAAFIKVHGEFKPGETIDLTTDSLYNTGKVSSYSQRLSNSQREFNANGLQLGFKHNFPKQGEELTGDINYFSGKNNNEALYTTNYYSAPNGNVTGTQYQQVIGDGTNKFVTIQTDYVKPLKGKTKIETGVRVQLRNTTNNTDTYLKAVGAGDYSKVNTGTTNYKNKDNVYAAYVSVTSGFKDFGYQLGLRAESSNYNGELTNTGEKFSNKYPVNLFPSVFLSQKLNHKQELQLSFTRRINRPNFFQLIPYTDYTDSLNITSGNPNLVPEFTNSLEFSYGKTFSGNNNILASVYYKHTTGLITRYLDTAINPATGSKDIINTYENANSSYSVGAEFTSVNYLTKWWDITSNINIYKSKINTDNLTGTSQDAMWSWFGKFNSNFKLPKNFSLQLSADYQSKTNLPVTNNTNQGGGPPMQQAQASSQGFIRPFWGMDFAVKKSFLKNNAATVTLTVSDIFRTRKSDQYSTSDFFVQNYYRLNNPQMVRLTFSYRFGKMDMSLFKRQNTKGQANAMEGMNQ